MTKEERKEYARDYRRLGLGRLADERYRQKNKERLRELARQRYHARRDGGI